MNLSTPRLHLREFNQNDAAFIVELLNTPGWINHIGDRGVRNIDDAASYIDHRFIQSYPSPYTMHALELKDTADVIGMAGLVKREWLPYPDVGYALLPQYEGCGFATEAAGAFLKFAKNELNHHVVCAVIDPRNEGSAKVLLRLGFCFDHELEHEGRASFVFIHKDSLL